MADNVQMLAKFIYSMMKNQEHEKALKTTALFLGLPVAFVEGSLSVSHIPDEYRLLVSSPEQATG